MLSLRIPLLIRKKGPKRLSIKAIENFHKMLNQKSSEKTHVKLLKKNSSSNLRRE